MICSMIIGIWFILCCTFSCVDVVYVRYSVFDVVVFLNNLYGAPDMIFMKYSLSHAVYVFFILKVHRGILDILLYYGKTLIQWFTPVRTLLHWYNVMVHLWYISYGKSLDTLIIINYSKNFHKLIYHSENLDMVNTLIRWLLCANT